MASSVPACVLALIRTGPAAPRLGRDKPSGTKEEPLVYAQLSYFNGPRTPEQLAAADFATQARIIPAVTAVAGNIRSYVLRRADGTEIVVSIADSEQTLIDTQKAIMGTQLLPGEDPALLPGPDRVELYPVLDVVDHEQVSS